jgi:hypothetical protein
MMKRMSFTILGKRQILFHRFNISALQQTQKVKEGTAGNNPNEWKTSFYSEGVKVYVPYTYLFGCIVKGGKHVKAGRGTISANLAGTLDILDRKLFFENRMLPKEPKELTLDDIGMDANSPIYVDVRMVSNPNTKGKNVRYRLAFCEGWILRPVIEWDDLVISVDQMKAAVVSAGKYVGLSDDRSIGGGRFFVQDVKIENVVDEISYLNTKDSTEEKEEESSDDK